MTQVILKIAGWSYIFAPINIKKVLNNIYYILRYGY